MASHIKAPTTCAFLIQVTLARLGARVTCINNMRPYK